MTSGKDQCSISRTRSPRSDPGTDGVSFIRRPEGLAVRRSPHARAERCALLPPAEDDHHALADGNALRGGVRHADYGLTHWRPRPQSAWAREVSSCSLGTQISRQPLSQESHMTFPVSLSK